MISSHNYVCVRKIKRIFFIHKKIFEELLYMCTIYVLQNENIFVILKIVFFYKYMYEFRICRSSSHLRRFLFFFFMNEVSLVDRRGDGSLCASNAMMEINLISKRKSRDL